MLVGIGLLITTVVTPFALFRLYLLEKENKDLRKRLGRGE
jgi:hypothetical protein